MSKESEKFTGIFENGTTQSHSCFRCQKKISLPFDGNFSPKFPYKRSALKERIQFPLEWFGTPTWPLFYCFKTPIWRTWSVIFTLISIGYFNPLSNKTDQHQISPCNINALKNKVVMRITDMITHDEFACYFITFSPLLLWEMKRDNKWEFKFWS